MSTKTLMGTLSSSSAELRLQAMRQGRKPSTAQAFTKRVFGHKDLLTPSKIKELAEEENEEQVEGEKEGEQQHQQQQHPHTILSLIPKMNYRKKYLSQDFKARLKTVEVQWNYLKRLYKLMKNKKPDHSFLSNQIKVMEGHFGSGIGTMFVFIRWVIFLNIGLSIIWSIFIIIPMAIAFDYSSPSQKFAFKNLLDGQGAVGQSWFFFGAYEPELNSYHMGLAYLIMILITYFGSLFIILMSIASAEDPISGSKQFNTRFAYSLIMWTSWDHSVSTAEATDNLSKGIASAFKDHMYEEKVKYQKKRRNREDPRGTIIRRLVAWFITLLLVGGGCAGITYLVMTISVDDVKRTADNMSFVKIYFTPIFISLINVLVPFSIRMLAKMEHYSSGQVELNITLARIFILRMVYLIALIASVIYKSNLKSPSELVANYLWCTGTNIGQELYRLVIMDTFINTGADILVYFGRYFWTHEKQEYIISTSVLVLIYRQSLILAGTMTCPMLPLIGLVSDIEFFFMVYYVMLYTCKPPLKRWKQSRKTQFIMTFLLISLLCIIFAVSFIIGSDYVNLGSTNDPKIRVGPFRKGKIPTDMFSHFVDNMEMKEMRMFCKWLVSETVVLPVFLILISLLGYQYKRITGENKHALILQVELQQERADNKILAKKLREQQIFFGINDIEFYDDDYEGGSEEGEDNFDYDQHYQDQNYQGHYQNLHHQNPFQNLHHQVHYQDLNHQVHYQDLNHQVHFQDLNQVHYQDLHHQNHQALHQEHHEGHHYQDHQGHNQNEETLKVETQP